MKNYLCLDVRTEEGRSQLNLSLEELSEKGRALVRGVLEVVRHGGSANFSPNPGEEGEMLLTFSLREPPAKVSNAVAQAIARH